MVKAILFNPLIASDSRSFVSGSSDRNPVLLSVAECGKSKSPLLLKTLRVSHNGRLISDY